MGGAGSGVVRRGESAGGRRHQFASSAREEHPVRRVARRVLVADELDVARRAARSGREPCRVSAWASPAASSADRIRAAARRHVDPGPYASPSDHATRGPEPESPLRAVVEQPGDEDVGLGHALAPQHARRRPGRGDGRRRASRRTARRCAGVVQAARLRRSAGDTRAVRCDTEPADLRSPPGGVGTDQEVTIGLDDLVPDRVAPGGKKMSRMTGGAGRIPYCVEHRPDLVRGSGIEERRTAPSIRRAAGSG